ncbi:hypothetical protein EIQ12_18210, partial [Xanthomonas campestris pv. campestris]
MVVKLHGSITTPDKLIFTASDYAKARSQSSAVYDLVRALLCTHTFLFLVAPEKPPSSTKCHRRQRHGAKGWPSHRPHPGTQKRDPAQQPA